jgi:hypothetical protein
MDLKRSASPGSVWKIKRKEEGKYELRLRNLMSPANEHDEHILKEAIPFARYAHVRTIFKCRFIVVAVCCCNKHDLNLAFTFLRQFMTILMMH